MSGDNRPGPRTRIRSSHLLERARRMASDPPPGNAVGDLVADFSVEEVAELAGVSFEQAHAFAVSENQADNSSLNAQ